MTSFFPVLINIKQPIADSKAKILTFRTKGILPKLANQTNKVNHFRSPLCVPSSLSPTISCFQGGGGSISTATHWRHGAFCWGRVPPRHRRSKTRRRTATNVTRQAKAKASQHAPPCGVQSGGILRASGDGLESTRCAQAAVVKQQSLWSHNTLASELRLRLSDTSKTNNDNISLPYQRHPKVGEFSTSS